MRHSALGLDVAEAPIAIDDCCRARFLHDVERRARHDVPFFNAINICGDLDDAVAVVPGQVGIDAMPGDSFRLAPRGTSAL